MRHALRLALLALVLAQCSCATTALTPAAESMPAARASLAPELRFFYDALSEDGEWMLIEPYGYVFRPSVNRLAWRPYEQGFWVPSEVYGWTWVSTESFGWATYHYGAWIDDRFEGWVWIPGSEWGPAWVAWQQGDGYVGWAPLGPLGFSNGVPMNTYSYVTEADLPSTNLPSHLMHERDLVTKQPRLEPVERVVDREGLRFNQGPSIETIERAAGRTLPRVQVDDLMNRPGVAVKPGAPTRPAQPLAPDSVLLTRRAGREAAREARTLVQGGGPPPQRVPVVRVAPAMLTKQHGERDRVRGAAPRDTTR